MSGQSIDVYVTRTVHLYPLREHRVDPAQDDAVPTTTRLERLMQR